MESHEIALAAFTHETISSSSARPRQRNLDTLREDIRLVAQFGGEANVISRCTFTIYQRNTQLEHVDVAAEVRKSIAADSNTTFALRNDEYPTYAIYKQARLKLAISYRLSRQQMRQIQLEFFREHEFRNILKILEMLRCPLRESVNQASSVMGNTTRPASQASQLQQRQLQVDGARRQRTAIAPKPTPVPTSRSPSRWFTAEERRPSTNTVRPRTEFPAPVPDWDTPVTARYDNLPVPPRRELPFSRSTTPQGFLQPSTPLKRNFDTLVKDSQPQKVAQSPYFKRPTLSHSQGETQGAVPDSQHAQISRTQTIDGPNLPESQVTQTQINGEASLSSEPSMQAPITSDSVLNNTTSATTADGTTIKDVFNGLSSDLDRENLKPFLDLSEEQQTIYLDDLVVRLAEDEGFLRVAECMQKCWKRIGLDPA